VLKCEVNADQEYATPPAIWRRGSSDDGITIHESARQQQRRADALLVLKPEVQEEQDDKEPVAMTPGTAKS
jgi:hypothetical protein